jgi:hypothetical protein
MPHGCFFERKTMNLKRYIDQVSAFMQDNYLYKFIAENGREFKPIEFDPRYQQFKGKMKDCFYNAYRMAQITGLDYVEGFADSIVPTLHAWVTDGTHAIDPTWPYNINNQYVGVVLPFSYVNKIVMERKAYGVLDSWEIGSPLISGKHAYNKKTQTVNMNELRQDLSEQKRQKKAVS